MFPKTISLHDSIEFNPNSTFGRLWSEAMIVDCHRHALWSDPLACALNDENTGDEFRFALASVWSTNMVVGSYCFPRYVAALSARAQEDAIRYGLLENAWDESGSYGHKSRSHFWLAVRLSRLLGLSDQEIGNIRPLPEAQEYTDEHYNQCSQGDFGFALGMICLIEEFTTPEFTAIFSAFLSSCESGLGMSKEDFVLKGGAEYFTANIADDERHRREMPSLVATWLRSNEVDLDSPTDVVKALKPVREGARFSADLRQRFFAGIYRFVEQGGRFRDLVHSWQTEPLLAALSSRH
jgi:pyrroloquinoline quinone (PQQ) biosynthesis protein C